jgi:hypothetical protein
VRIAEGTSRQRTGRALRRIEGKKIFIFLHRKLVGSLYMTLRSGLWTQRVREPMRLYKEFDVQVRKTSVGAAAFSGYATHVRWPYNLKGRWRTGRGRMGRARY